MDDVFISYSHQDHAVAWALSRELNAKGYSVWWDERLTAGDTFHTSITEKVNEVQVVIVIWSEHSAKSNWVVAEASMAFDQSKLLPVRVGGLDLAAIPMPFNTVHTVDADRAELIIAALNDRMSNAASPQQGGPAVPRKIPRRRLVAASVAVVLIAAATAVYFSETAVQMAVDAFVRQTLDLEEPCAGLRVAVGDNVTGESFCVDPKEPGLTPLQDCNECPPLVVLPGGVVQIGSPRYERGRDEDEEPQKTVVLDPFAVGLFEVRRMDWHACVKAGRCAEKRTAQQANLPNLPVSGVNWTETQEYLGWLSEKTAQEFRLLSEAEWEYAARAGSDTPWPWGADEENACSFANVGDMTRGALPRSRSDAYARPEHMSIELGGRHTCSDHQPLISPVGVFEANAFGLYDMIGNVWEWVEDCHFSNLEETPRDGSARFKANCVQYVVRGGSYLSGPNSTRSANRFKGGRSPSTHQADIGFRVARDIDVSSP